MDAGNPNTEMPTIGCHVPDPDFITGCCSEKYNTGCLCCVNLQEGGGN